MTTETRVYVTSATFGAATVGIEWVESTGVREPGLVRSNFIEIPAETVEFADEAHEAVTAVERLLVKALEVWQDAPTLVAGGDVAELEDDDAPGPYDNPVERPQACGCPGWDGVHEPDCPEEEG